MIDVFVASSPFYFCLNIVAVLYHYLSICRVSSFSFGGIFSILSILVVALSPFSLVLTQCVASLLLLLSMMMCSLWCHFCYRYVFLLTLIIFIALALLPFVLLLISMCRVYDWCFCGVVAVFIFALASLLFYNIIYQSAVFLLFLFVALSLLIHSYCGIVTVFFIIDTMRCIIAVVDDDDDMFFVVPFLLLV